MGKCECLKTGAGKIISARIHWASISFVWVRMCVLHQIVRSYSACKPITSGYLYCVPVWMQFFSFGANKQQHRSIFPSTNIFVVLASKYEYWQDMPSACDRLQWILSRFDKKSSQLFRIHHNFHSKCCALSFKFDRVCIPFLSQIEWK